MTNTELLVIHQWSLAPFVGFEHPFLTVNSHTLIYTWIMLGVLTGILLICRFAVMGKNRVAQYLILSFMSSIIDTTTQALTFFSFKHCAFIGSLFCFIFLGNTLSLIPWLEEPTKDLNTTLALGIVAFMYIQYYAIKHNGIVAYTKNFFSPFFLMFPVNVVGKLASIVSLSFRLFGNIFGGYIIANLWFSTIARSIILEMIGLVLGINLAILLFFCLFEGFLQAFIFTMLTVTYLSIAIQGGGH